MIAPEDRGFTLGDGLFETILADRRELKLWDAHMARLARGAETLGLPAPDTAACREAAVAKLVAGGLHDARAAVRLTWSAGPGGRGLDRPEAPAPTLAVSVAASPRPSTPVRLATATVRRNESSPAARLKTLSYLDNVLARREAQAAGADEALMLNSRGEIACAAVANLFWFDGDVLVTPALECGVLDGIMRAALVDGARGAGMTVREVRASPSSLALATGLFLTNSLIGLRPVSSLDGRAFPPDPRLERLAAMVSDVA